MENINAVGNNRNLKTCGTALFLFLFFALFSVSVFSFSYDYNGYLDKAYFNPTVTTLFNENFVSNYGNPLTYARQSTGNLTTNALMSDLDGDGNNELFVINSNSVNVYNTASLNLTAIIPLAGVGFKQYISDNKLIVLVGFSGTNILPLYVKVYSWNGTDYNKVQDRRIPKDPLNPDGTVYGAKIGLSCYIDECVIIELGAGGSQNYVWAGLLDLALTTTDNVTMDYQTALVSNCGADECRPSYPFDIVNGDFDNDGKNDFSFTYVGKALGAYNGYIATVEFNGTGFETIDSTFIGAGITKITNMLGGGQYNTGGLDTTAFATMTAGGVTLYSYYSDTANWIKIKEKTFTGYDNIGNSFACTFLPSNYQTDSCVLAYKNTDKKIALLGLTGHGVNFGQAYYVEALSSEIENYFTTAYTIDNQGHSIYTSTDKSFTDDNFGTVTLSDVITPYGIYRIGNGWLLSYFTGQANLDAIYRFPNSTTKTAFQPAFMQNKPFADLFGQSTTNIFYYSDKFIVPAVQIDGYSINPCAEQVWKLNTSVQVTITPKSYSNLYTVSAKATLYYGDTNQQTYNFTAFASNGQVFSFDFIANKTIANGILLLEAQDSQGTTAVKSIPFSVSAIGVNFNDCQTTATGLTSTQAANVSASAAINENKANFSMTNNFVTTGVYNQANSMGVPVLLFFILVLFGSDVVIFLYSIKHIPQFQQHVSALIGFIFFIDLTALIIATYMQIINAAFLITMIILILIIGGFAIAKYFNKSHAGG